MSAKEPTKRTPTVHQKAEQKEALAMFAREWGWTIKEVEEYALRMGVNRMMSIHRFAERKAKALKKAPAKKAAPAKASAKKAALPKKAPAKKAEAAPALKKPAAKKPAPKRKPAASSSRKSKVDSTASTIPPAPLSSNAAESPVS